jgi:hypothetical protein
MVTDLLKSFVTSIPLRPDPPDHSAALDRPQEAAAVKSGSYDAVLKALFKRYHFELAAWLTGKRPVEASEVDTAHGEVQVRFSDKFLRLRFEKSSPVLLHVEFQSAGDHDMPTRMTGYMALLAETLKLALSEGKEFSRSWRSRWASGSSRACSWPRSSIRGGSRRRSRSLRPRPRT